MEDVEGSDGGGAAFKRDWTKGSITRNLVSLAWPMIVTESLYMVTVVDMIWVGKLGATSIAGLGVASIVTMLIMVAKLGLIAGVRATVARFAGAGATGLTNHTAGQSLVIGVVWGLVMTAPLLEIVDASLHLLCQKMFLSSGVRRRKHRAGMC